MSSENRNSIAGLRHYYQKELQPMIRQMKIEGGTLDDCITELSLLAEFVRSQADGLSDAWPSLLRGTGYESWEQSQNQSGAKGAPRR
jgi:hypothetical protein